jgi:hypothetical protein
MTNKINDGNFNPIKSILSRYSICNINSNNYATIPIYTGNTTSTQQGVIFAPYIMVDQLYMDDDFMAKIKRYERRKKLERLLSDL